MTVEATLDRDVPERPAPTTARKVFRMGQIVLYGAVSMSIWAWTYTQGRFRTDMTVLGVLLGFYMGARALAIYIRFSQDIRGPRYSRAYIEARDVRGRYDDDDTDTPPPHDPGNTDGRNPHG